MSTEKLKAEINSLIEAAYQSGFDQGLRNFRYTGGVEMQTPCFDGDREGVRLEAKPGELAADYRARVAQVAYERGVEHGRAVYPAGTPIMTPVGDGTCVQTTVQRDDCHDAIRLRAVQTAYNRGREEGYQARKTAEFAAGLPKPTLRDKALAIALNIAKEAARNGHAHACMAAMSVHAAVLGCAPDADLDRILRALRNGGAYDSNEHYYAAALCAAEIRAIK